MADTSTIRSAVLEYAQLHCLVQNTICMSSYDLAMDLKKREKMSKKWKNLSVLHNGLEIA